MLLCLGPNISPLLGKQLVLELEVGVALDEELLWLPSSIVGRKALLLHQNIPGDLLEVGSPHPARRQDQATIMDGWQGWRSRWRVTMEGLEQPYMEDIMKARARL